MRTVLRALTTMLTALLGLALVLGGGLVAPATAAGTSSITGTVAGPGGAGEAGVTVAAFISNGGSWDFAGVATTSDGAGEYDLVGLSAGTYRIGFQLVGGRVAYYLDATTIAEATDVLIGDD
ncbi:hypothetical protein, partial [Nocardioides sp. P5_C9_2]